jgi:curved DNA-binding protein
LEYKDYYKTLGLSKGASEQDIKQAYRSLARQYHPDVNPDAAAAERFKEINEAYQVLSDTDKRRRFDQISNSYDSWQRTGKSSSGFDWSKWTDAATQQQDSSGGIFSDFFTSIFGDGGRRSSGGFGKQPIQGYDQELDVTITLEEAFNGTRQRVDKGRQSFNAHIPPGVKSGSEIRFKGQGEAGFAGGRPGDLYIKVTVREHSIYTREGDDLSMDLEVPLYTAVLGGEVRIKTLDGHVRLRIPPGTQSGQTIRLRERGMPVLNREGEFGDLFARVLIQVPENLTAEERDLFEQLARLRRKKKG